MPEHVHDRRRQLKRILIFLPLNFSLNIARIGMTGAIPIYKKII